MRKDFDRQIRAKILCNAEEISTIAQLKSKMAKKMGATDGKTKGKAADSGNMYEPTPDFKEPEKPPYFLCAVPATFTLFEVFFDLESN